MCSRGREGTPDYTKNLEEGVEWWHGWGKESSAPLDHGRTLVPCEALRSFCRSSSPSTSF